jgi:hypothetical protein
LAVAGGTFYLESAGRENDRADATPIVVNAWNNRAIKTPTGIRPTEQSADGVGCSHAVIGEAQCSVETHETVAEPPATPPPPTQETAPAAPVQVSATGSSALAPPVEQPPTLSEGDVDKNPAVQTDKVNETPADGRAFDKSAITQQPPTRAPVPPKVADRGDGRACPDCATDDPSLETLVAIYDAITAIADDAE